MPAVALGGMFLTSAFAATTIGTITAGLIGGALIGAAIGGISAAVMGGDIGKGMLFGAVGGAVMGGIGGWVAGPSATGASGLTMGASTAHEAARGGVLAATQGVGQTIAGGTGTSMFGDMGTGAALVTTGGQMLMGAFDDSGEVAASEAEKARAHSRELAQLQAETQLKIAEMSGKSGGSSSDAAKYAADLQLLNAREQRQQDYKLKSEEWSMLEASRNRRRAAVEGISFKEAQEPQATQPGPVAPGVMNPVAAQPIPYAPAQQGMLQQPQEVPVGQ